MNELISYSTLYPEIPLELIRFFSQVETINGRMVHKDIMGFCSYYKDKYLTKELPQPRIVIAICDKLCEHGQLSIVQRGGLLDMKNSYFCIINESIEIEESHWNKMLSYIVYGFKYIYEDYKQYVLPIEHTDKIGDKSLGTCFLYCGGIVTAKHCIESASKIAILGIPKEDLKTAKFEISENIHLDLVYIRFNKPINKSIRICKKAEVLDEIMTLGFPKISGFHNFMVAESAIVSSRFTTSTGQIVAKAKDIWVKENLFLITAKIKGGNSGGPVIARDGSVIGVSVSISEGEGDYDNLGYGTVIPVELVNELIGKQEKEYLAVGNMEFLDFS